MYHQRHNLEEYDLRSYSRWNNKDQQPLPRDLVPNPYGYEILERVEDFDWSKWKISHRRIHAPGWVRMKIKSLENNGSKWVLFPVAKLGDLFHQRYLRKQNDMSKQHGSLGSENEATATAEDQLTTSVDSTTSRDHELRLRLEHDGVNTNL
ncbi:MAG: hypothetical protein KatS3mg113_0301 [Planctomycetaceae bacterium]|nr:MAG: hypothetical protein KatS3mg113_0301 [Planctomycetaceae bacterium]